MEAVGVALWAVSALATQTRDAVSMVNPLIGTQRSAMRLWQNHIVCGAYREFEFSWWIRTLHAGTAKNGALPIVAKLTGKFFSNSTAPSVSAVGSSDNDRQRRGL